MRSRSGWTQDRGEIRVAMRPRPPPPPEAGVGLAGSGARLGPVFPRSPAPVGNAGPGPFRVRRRWVQPTRLSVAPLARSLTWAMDRPMHARRDDAILPKPVIAQACRSQARVRHLCPPGGQNPSGSRPDLGGYRPRTDFVFFAIPWTATNPRLRRSAPTVVGLFRRVSAREPLGAESLADPHVTARTSGDRPGERREEAAFARPPRAPGVGSGGSTPRPGQVGVRLETGQARVVGTRGPRRVFGGEGATMGPPGPTGRDVCNDRRPRAATKGWEVRRDCPEGRVRPGSPPPSAQTHGQAVEIVQGKALFRAVSPLRKCLNFPATGSEVVPVCGFPPGPQVDLAREARPRG